MLAEGWERIKESMKPSCSEAQIRDCVAETMSEEDSYLECLACTRTLVRGHCVRLRVEGVSRIRGNGGQQDSRTASPSKATLPLMKVGSSATRWIAQRVGLVKDYRSEAGISMSMSSIHHGLFADVHEGLGTRCPSHELFRNFLRCGSRHPWTRVGSSPGTWSRDECD